MIQNADYVPPTPRFVVRYCSSTDPSGVVRFGPATLGDCMAWKESKSGLACFGYYRVQHAQNDGSGAAS